MEAALTFFRGEMAKMMEEVEEEVEEDQFYLHHHLQQATSEGE